MVDSGAEMNLVTPQLADILKRQFAVDETGKEFHMKNASGSVSQLHGRFNSIPVKLGGKRCDTTFFIGEAWNSGVHVILGQTFLRRYACSMIWDTQDGEERMFLHLYPSGQRDKPPIVAEMFETETPKWQTMAALVTSAETALHESASEDNTQARDQTVEPHHEEIELSCDSSVSDYHSTTSDSDEYMSTSSNNWTDIEPKMKASQVTPVCVLSADSFNESKSLIHKEDTR